MSKESARIYEMRMDMNNMLEYRGAMERKRNDAIKAGNTQLMTRLNKQLDIMDELFETVWICTVSDIAPTFVALLGSDFDVDVLKMALPEHAAANITEDTQIMINYVEEKEPIVSSKPAVNEEDYMSAIRELLLHNVVDNIQTAIDIYNERTGKNLMPADAWTEIKDAFPDCKPPKMWDNWLSTQFRMHGPLYPYAGIKKHLPTWSDTEIGRICEDAIKRRIVDQATPFSEAKELEDLLNTQIEKRRVEKWIKDPKAQEIVNLYHRNISDKELEEIKIPREKYEQKQIGRIIAAMTPSVRVKMEKPSRIPYVEKGYPAK